ncbi:MAG: hypothetical protein A2607_01745 [Candidatus Vogelbacteria bacterium RIFOXYD1_FULL_42_15]|uniref:Uncharacterized protein n=1 Tax=Candidatus Vogelbacteria bacterium RIFOXYD1_FULL_42_15 TaxID=1802437 RepID=A0A1G2QIU7_9BACT|nr:MAG: hypothetical protein A2607_01745 [Candidatus Vogelbacteria bacterium RIFOXYD1_FULL_42_15]
MLGLNKKELAVLKRLTTPMKIQAFLDSFPFNHEKTGETYMSPRRVLKAKKMHCLEGALVAGVALWLRGEEPWLVDLKAPGDLDHVIALYQRNGYWGAISKTNHSVLRWRDPIYKTVRELVLSYFHEYSDDQTGRKTLRAYSAPFNLKKLGEDWITAEKELFFIAQTLDERKHFSLVPKKNLRLIRPADQMERRAGELIEWSKTNPKT